MVAKTAEDPKGLSPEQAAPPSGGGPLPRTRKGGKGMKIAGIVVVMIAVEVAATWYFLAPASARKTPGKTDPADANSPPSEPDTEAASSDTAEVPIGNGFGCTNNKAAASAIHIDFKLVALVTPSQRVKFDLSIKEHEARIRQAVIKVARSSSLEDLNDPNLGTMKRLIREEINKILHKSYVLEVVISEFTTMEQ